MSEGFPFCKRDRNNPIENALIGYCEGLFRGMKDSRCVRPECAQGVSRPLNARLLRFEQTYGKEAVDKVRLYAMLKGRSTTFCVGCQFLDTADRSTPLFLEQLARETLQPEYYNRLLANYQELVRKFGGR